MLEEFYIVTGKRQKDSSQAFNIIFKKIPQYHIIEYSSVISFNPAPRFPQANFYYLIKHRTHATRKSAGTAVAP